MGNQKKILIVDDDPEMRAILSARLKANRFRVLEASNGLASVDVAKKGRPDLIVLNLIMTGQNGIEAYHALRQDAETKAIPIVFLTVLTPNNTIAVQSLQLATSTGSGLEVEKNSMILSKPYRPQELVEEIRKVLR